SPVRCAGSPGWFCVAGPTPTLPTQAQAKCGQGHAQKNNFIVTCLLNYFSDLFCVQKVLFLCSK
ncbi:MAG: hypothetical protein NZ519_12135, partial [Bacteroidia bacterium]|nr:hypothetical protein [Bacteroidia bacterium]